MNVQEAHELVEQIEVCDGRSRQAIHDIIQTAAIKVASEEECKLKTEFSIHDSLDLGPSQIERYWIHEIGGRLEYLWHDLKIHIGGCRFGSHGEIPEGKEWILFTEGYYRTIEEAQATIRAFEEANE